MKVVFLVLVVLFLGCAQQAQPELPNESTSNETVPNGIVNETFMEEIASGDLSLPQQPENESITNQKNQTNESQTSESIVPPQDPAPPEGIPFAGSPYVLVLDDVSMPLDSEQCGIFSIRYAENGTVMDRMLICPGDSQYWHSPEGHTYRILVVKVAAGYTYKENWAKVIIFG